MNTLAIVLAVLVSTASTATDLDDFHKLARKLVQAVFDAKLEAMCVCQDGGVHDGAVGSVTVSTKTLNGFQEWLPGHRRAVRPPVARRRGQSRRWYRVLQFTTVGK